MPSSIRERANESSFTQKTLDFPATLVHYPWITTSIHLESLLPPPPRLGRCRSLGNHRPAVVTRTLSATPDPVGQHWAGSLRGLPPPPRRRHDNILGGKEQLVRCYDKNIGTTAVPAVNRDGHDMQEGRHARLTKVATRTATRTMEPDREETGGHEGE